MFSDSLGPKDYEKRSKLSFALGHGSSKRSAKAWLASRIIMVFNIVLSLYIFISIINGYAAYYESLHIWLYNPLNQTVLIMACITFALQSMFGFREIIHDYVDCKTTQLVSTTVVYFLLIFMSLLSIVSIINV